MKEMFWNWGHLAGSHNDLVKQDCQMSIEGFAEEFKIPNAFVVSYGGNIQPPFDGLAEKLSGLKDIKWSILGDSSTPLPEDELGFTNEIIELAKKFPNVTGGVMDDFYSEERLKRFPPSVLKKIQQKLSENGLDFWAVLYAHELHKEAAKEHFDCFDGITYWVWEQEDIQKLDELIQGFFEMYPDKRKMVGVYLWDYAVNKPMEESLYRKQLDYYQKLLNEKKVEGIIFCSSCIGDANLETNTILKNM